MNWLGSKAFSKSNKKELLCYQNNINNLSLLHKLFSVGLIKLNEEKLLFEK